MRGMWEAHQHPGDPGAVRGSHLMEVLTRRTVAIKGPEEEGSPWRGAEADCGRSSGLWGGSHSALPTMSSGHFSKAS